MKPKVSVIVPCHNSEKTIGKTLESLINQSFKDFELLVVDDASTDNSLKVIKALGVRALALEKNMGVSFARNRGSEAASGNLLLFLDADCWAESNWVKRMVDGLTEEGVEVIAGNIRIPNSTVFANAVAELGFPGGANAGFENMWRVSANGFTNHVSSCNFGIKRPVLDSVNGFDESLRRGQDAYLSFALSQNRARIKYCSEAVVFHEPTVSFERFVRNNVMRGKANLLFKSKVGNVRPFVSLRLWSSKNILRKNLFKARLPLVFSLLSLSFVLQQAGYLREKLGFRSRK